MPFVQGNTGFPEVQCVTGNTGGFCHRLTHANLYERATA